MSDFEIEMLCRSYNKNGSNLLQLKVFTLDYACIS